MKKASNLKSIKSLVFQSLSLKFPPKLTIFQILAITDDFFKFRQLLMIFSNFGKKLMIFQIFSLSTEAFPQYRWTRMDPDNRQIVLFRHQTTKFCQKSPNCSFFAKFKKPSLLRGRRNLKNLRCWEEEEKPSILRGRKNTPTKNKVLNLENIQNPNECARAYMEPPYRWYWFFINSYGIFADLLVI